MERSGDSVVSQSREMIDFDIGGRRVGSQRRDLEIWRFRRVTIKRNDRCRYRRVDVLAVSAEMERSGDSVVFQYREMIDFDIDGSTRVTSMQRWRDLAIPSRPIIEK